MGGGLRRNGRRPLGAFVWRALIAWRRVASLLCLHPMASCSWSSLALFLGTMSIVGDLVESCSSEVLASGTVVDCCRAMVGVLDRVDALLPVLPLAMLLSSL